MPYPIDDTQQVGATLPASAPPWSNVTFPPQPPPPATTAPSQTAPSGGPVPPPGPSIAGRLTDPKALLAMILPMLSGLAARGSGGMNSAGALMQGMLKGYLTAQEAKWNRMEFEGQAEQAKFERETLLMKMVSEGSAHIADLADDPTQQMIFYRQFSEYLENAPAFRGHEDLVRRGLMRPPANAGSRAVAKAADKLVEKLDKDNPAWRENPENLVNLAETEPVLRRAVGAQIAAKKLLALRTTVTTPEGGRPTKAEPKRYVTTKWIDAKGVERERRVEEGTPEAMAERITGRAPIQAPSEARAGRREAEGVKAGKIKQAQRKLVALLRKRDRGEAVDLSAIRRELEDLGLDYETEVDEAASQVERDLAGLAGATGRLAPQETETERLTGGRVTRPEEIAAAQEAARALQRRTRGPGRVDPADLITTITMEEIRAVARSLGITEEEAKAQAKTRGLTITGR